MLSMSVHMLAREPVAGAATAELAADAAEEAAEVAADTAEDAAEVAEDIVEEGELPQADRPRATAAAVTVVRTVVTGIAMVGLPFLEVLGSIFAGGRDIQQTGPVRPAR